MIDGKTPTAFRAAQDGRPRQFFVAVLLLLGTLFAGGNSQAGVTPLEQHFGATQAPAAGCSHCAAEDTELYVEVTPGLATLVVDVFDPEAVAGGTSLDSNTGTTAFEIFDPSGTKASGFTCTTGGVCTCDIGSTCGAVAGGGTLPAGDNNWVNFVIIAAPAAGHWRITSDVASNAGVNGYQVRAHDGDPTGGGEEVNLYLQRAFTPGNSNADSNPKTDTYYPYITGGCEYRQNDFDFDSNNANAGAQSITISSRTGAFTDTLINAELSLNGFWQSNLISGFTDQTSADEYGVWTITTSINGLTANNRTDNYIGRYDSFDPTGLVTIPGGLQNLSQTHRVYVANDAGAAPLKPYLSHTISSTNVPLLNNVTRHTVTVTFTNPTPYAVTFDQADTVLGADNDNGGTSGANVIIATVPVDPFITYAAGTAAPSAGVIVSQPAGAAGDVVWDPGAVAGGSSVSLTYGIDIAPNAIGTITVTGDPASLDGTDAEFLDETGMLDVYFGALCDMALVPVSGSAVIGNEVFEDLDGNGALTAGEELAGVTVTLSGLDGAGNLIELSTTTDGSGLYQFSGLPAGDYVVTVDESTLPIDLQGNNSVDPDGGGDSTAAVTVAAGETNNAQDFGYIGQADVTIAKTLTMPAPPIASGQTVDYEILVNNDGPGVATDVTVTDTPAGLNSVVITNPGVCDVSIGAGNTFPCVISTIAATGVVTINVQAVLP